MKCLYITLIILFLNASHGALFSNLIENELSLFERSSGNVKSSNYVTEPRPQPLRFYRNKKKDILDKKFSVQKLRILKDLRRYEENEEGDRMQLTEAPNPNPLGLKQFIMDLRRRSRKDTDSTDESSSMEIRNWMEEWDQEWMQKKFEALNSSQYRGDVVNMVAARPWGVPCGDPNQHDMPWGSCTLPAECEGEYRVYRGDFLCGRTEFVCCSLQLTNYDMYQAMDVSFIDSSMSTDSKENKGSKQNERKKKEREKKRRRKEREKRKKQIKKDIREITSEIKKILNRAYRNTTAQRKKKTKELRKFVDDLKEAFRKERLDIVSVHEYEMVKIDEALQQRLGEIEKVNKAFMMNDTFRDIIVNGTVDTEKAISFLRTHPKMAQMFQRARTEFNKKNKKLSAKSNIRKMNPKYIKKKMSSKYKRKKMSPKHKINKKKHHGRRSNTLDNYAGKKNFLEYDVEYGNLYI